MNPALWVSKTGLDAQQTRLSLISNNLANVNTTGFKRDQAIFQDLIYQNKRQAGGQVTQDTRAPSGFSTGTGVRIVATQKLHTQGNITQTGNALDMAILGRGFFQIQQSDGTTSYTRDGTFQIDANGQVVTSQGQFIQPSLTIPSDTQSITIGQDGTVSVLTGNNTSPTQIGNIQLADFVNPAGLQPDGNNLFIETASSGSPLTGTPGLTGLGTLESGAVETSNVNVVEELVNMIETQRAYEMNSKVISTADQMLQYVSNNL
ncbi:Flagellar basal-body rod protein FlgG [hydrothermal vent metagenome]|uniref:Flagellar basal-body rod protein FlgG n=1 Tax=hydrothermal vent metagenome TaxID=652676 RepID=A0A3B0XT74_9ZZZZ